MHIHSLIPRLLGFWYPGCNWWISQALFRGLNEVDLSKSTKIMHLKQYIHNSHLSNAIMDTREPMVNTRPCTLVHGFCLCHGGKEFSPQECTSGKFHTSHHDSLTLLPQWTYISICLEPTVLLVGYIHVQRQHACVSGYVVTLCTDQRLTQVVECRNVYIAIVRLQYSKFMFGKYINSGETYIQMGNTVMNRVSFAYIAHLVRWFSLTTDAVLCLGVLMPRLSTHTRT